MKTLKQLFYYSFVILAIFCTSCEAEDGMDGVNGEQGIPGQDGADGQNGQDGEDGNANVTGVTVDPFPSWTEGIYLGQEANFVEIDEPLLTQEVVDDALVLVYFQLFGDNIWYPMTYAFPFDNGTDEIITYTYEEDMITIYALSSNGPVNAGISKVRYFIISTNDAGRSHLSSKEYILQDLLDNDVDINIYEEVANYYNR
ncbi:hypothetical protein [uncultured Dokdonia sp.]|uniref:hypothetical protein n=1 Tax=uncultured Dokdonia sp. TaxID=575653 RepID=UPI00262C71A9|nr:hypothetical protein [uncultured Dokdonia sp.]